jgi:hypothetical protein
MRPVVIGSGKGNMPLDDRISAHSPFLGAYPRHTHSTA